MLKKIRKRVRCVVEMILNYTPQNCCERQALNLSFLPQPLQQLFSLPNIHFGILCEILYHNIFPGKNTFIVASVV